MDDLILVTCIEHNKRFIDDNGEIYHRLYEQEAIRCFKSWRKNGGWLKDIPIYCLCCTKNKPSNNTIAAIKKMNVTYIEEIIPFNYNHLFINTIYTIYYFLKKFPSKRVLFIDLDVELIRPLEREIVDNEFVLCEYDINNKSQSEEYLYRKNNCNVIFNTYFMIVDSSFSKVVELVDDENYKDYYYKNIFYKKTAEDYFFEEGIYDYAYLKNMITPTIIKCSYLENKYIIHKHIKFRDIV